ncbi:MAG: NCS2 family permease [Pirellulales bacterium]|nr:NCS2 family permease [Pirellulales bacterium]
MLQRFFQLREHGTNVRTEVLAGLTTFLTMAYIIFLQPAILSGELFHRPTGIEPGAVMTATCLAAALATAIMALYARYPICQAPGMGENFFFVFSVIPAAGLLVDAGLADGSLQPGATSAWQIALGVVFLSGVLFVLLTVCGVREWILAAISPSMRHAIAIGIGLFIAFIGLCNAGLIQSHGQPPAVSLQINPRFDSPDLVVFFFGLLLTSVLLARRVRGAIVLGILASTLLAIAAKSALPHLPESIQSAPLVAESKLATLFTVTDRVVAAPPSMAQTFCAMDLVRAMSWSMVPFILIFLFMDVFDTLGTLIGVSERAGLMRDGTLPRMRQAMLSDAVATMAGAAMGTSTVTSFVESAAGVEQGGRTGLTALVVAGLFVAALFFSPIVAMVGAYPPITAPALVVVGSMMMRNVVHVEWDNPAEALPSFLVILGIPLTYSIADGLALGLVAYPLVKLLSGQARDVRWPAYVLAAVMVAYFVFIRTQAL